MPINTHFGLEAQRADEELHLCDLARSIAIEQVKSWHASKEPPFPVEVMFSLGAFQKATFEFLDLTPEQQWAEVIGELARAWLNSTYAIARQRRAAAAQ